MAKNDVAPSPAAPAAHAATGKAPSGKDLLEKSFRRTRLPNATIDCALQTFGGWGRTHGYHLISQNLDHRAWPPSVRRSCWAVMARRVHDYELRRALIVQTLAKPWRTGVDYFVWQRGARPPRQLPFPHWEELPDAVVRLFDWVVPPLNLIHAEILEQAPTPKTADLPKDPCKVVEVTFRDASFQPIPLTRILLWLDEKNCFEHYVEEYAGEDLFRTVVAEGWMKVHGRLKPPGSAPVDWDGWIASRRTFTDYTDRRQTRVTRLEIRSTAFEEIDPATFESRVLPRDYW